MHNSGTHQPLPLLVLREEVTFKAVSDKLAFLKTSKRPRPCPKLPSRWRRMAAKRHHGSRGSANPHK